MRSPCEKSGEMAVICKLINIPQNILLGAWGLSERHATLPCIPRRVATDFYNSVPVSSSHGLTSMRRLDLAMTAFSKVKKTLKKQQKKQLNIYTSLLYCWNFSPVAQVLNGYFEFTHLGSQAMVICKQQILTKENFMIRLDVFILGSKNKSLTAGPMEN